MTTETDKTMSTDGAADRLAKVREAIRDVKEPQTTPVTPEVVERLRSDPDLLRVAEIAEIYVVD
ncbi:MAG TPA: hypothetical protein VH063_06550 [Gaiellaceae bacterium]|nr:hypothetical protein [Gaiellaceae bacterium]